ncbi:MAG: glycosyltransferase family 2 protein [Deltaproteobacteria bacterium]|nr:glycosyltransferase family 2 protein [Deltaproteobacteria bacterium]
MKKPSLTIIVPAYNEEGNLEGAIHCIDEAVSGLLEDYEIIIFNDFSKDHTGEIANRLKQRDPHIKVVHNPRNMGFGYNYTEGVRLAEKEYVILVPGDNEIPSAAIKKILNYTGTADIVVPYTANPWVRPLSRRLVSRAFVLLVNILFGLRLRYYNGTCVHKSSLIKNIPMKTHGFAYMASILVRLIKSGANYMEVDVDIQERTSGKTNAFSIKNIASVIKTLIDLFVEVRVRERARYNSRPIRIETV